jgi:integrase
MSELSTPVATLASILDLMVEAPALTEQRRREIAGAVSTFCKVFKTEPHLMEASAPSLQKAFAQALPAAVGVTASRWRNVMSLLRAGLKLVDPDAFPARLKGKRLAGWEALFELTDARLIRRGLSRFSRWCTLHGIEPNEVSDKVLDRFGEDLGAHCVVRSPVEGQQTAANAWNKGRDTVPDWPEVTLRVPDRRKNQSMPWSAFPPSLGEDAEAFLAACAYDDDSLDCDRSPLRPATIKSKRVQLRQIATAIVESGVPADKLRSLADLVVPAHANAALTGLRKRTGQKKSGYVHKAAMLLVGVARHHVKADEETIAKLVIYRKNTKPKIQHTMTPKNRARLAQLDDPRQMDMLLLLPERLMTIATRIKEPTKTEALVAQDAIALSILTNVPLRISNLASLEVGRSLVMGERTGQIELDGSETKTAVPLTAPLPAPLIAQIKLYLKRFHPLLAPPGCAMLFPSRNGHHKDPTVIARQTMKRLRVECGIAFNPHLFRHLAAKLMLEESPGGYGSVMQLLHHKQIQTTIMSYCGTEGDAAHKKYNAIVDRLRAEVGEGPRA